MLLIPVKTKLEFSVFGVTWSFRNRSNLLVFCWRNVLNINVKNNCAA